ncbi:MAG: hypothetical protein MZV70_65645 [Desulfobacterales bacterium]|nr:hypothetical protein [Desulfobacterales bacterium]
MELKKDPAAMMVKNKKAEWRTKWHRGQWPPPDFRRCYCRKFFTASDSIPQKPAALILNDSLRISLHGLLLIGFVLQP